MKIYNKKIFNYGIITVILFLSIYFLYFYENTNSNILRENFNNSYTNICKDKPTHFYNIPTNDPKLIEGGNTDIKDSQDCRRLCESKSTCSLYFMTIDSGSKLSDVGYNDISNCYIYNSKLDSLGIDKNNIDICVNCINNTLPDTGDTYNGYGYVNTQYFKNNKDKFHYIDYYLDKAHNFITNIEDINKEKKSVFNTDKSRDTLQSKYDNFTKDVDILNQNLEINKNTLNSIYINDDKSVLKADISSNDTSYNIIDYVDKNYKNIKKNDFLKKKIDNANKKNTTTFIVYIILSIIMIITILLLLLYKLAPKYINDLVIISYFIGIIFLLLFLKFNKIITI